MFHMEQNANLTEAQRDELLSLAKRVAHNIPNRLRPDDFHQEKSEIVYRLRKMARKPEAQS